MRTYTTGSLPWLRAARADGAESGPFAALWARHCPPMRDVRTSKGVAGPELRGSLLKGDKPDALVPAPAVDQPLEHEQHLRAAADVRMQRHGEDGVVQFAVDPVKLVVPQSGVHRASSSRRCAIPTIWCGSSTRAAQGGDMHPG
jgi:hypothetical protein